MGFFGGYQLVVASQSYNMAGDELDRPDFLKTTVVSNVLVPNGKTMGENITETYLHGPGMKLRSFFRWALRNYEEEIPTRRNRLQLNVEVANLPDHFDVPEGETATTEALDFGPADYKYWAEQWMLENQPADVHTNWQAEYVEDTNEIIITFEDTTTVTFTPANYDGDADYYYVLYRLEPSNVVKMLIYRVGSGSIQALEDGISTATLANQEFYPVIPVRVDNEFVSDTYLPDIYEIAKRAYKKATTKRLDKLIDLIADNEDLEDIDYATIVFGVALNVRENACKEYLYRFFEQMVTDSGDTLEDGGYLDFTTWQAEQDIYEIQTGQYQDWEDGIAELGPDEEAPPPPPKPGTAPQPKRRSITLKSNSFSKIDYGFEITWNFIREETGTGLAKPDAKPGELWWDAVSSESYSVAVAVGTALSGNDVRETEESRLYWQIDENNWKCLHVNGLLHRNLVYGGQYVETTMSQALVDQEESRFIIPLHYPTFRAMPLIKSTQMSTACMFIVFNSYEFVEIPWYATGWFKVFIIIAIIVLTYVTGGFSATGFGILGANLAVGAAIGLSGAAAIIVGAIANAIAAMIITKLIQQVGVALLGDELGQIFAVIVSFLVINGLSNLSAGNGFALGIGNLGRAENLLKLAMPIGDAYGAYLGAKTQNIIEQTQELVQNYQEERERLEELYAENFGYARGLINPFELFVMSSPIEAPDAFLSRTLLVGGDIAELSLEMVSNFPEVTISTSLPGS